MHKLIELSKIFSDENRLNIIRLLLRDKTLCVCEICDTLGLSQPLVSRHLKQMRESGVVLADKDRKWVHYSLKKEKHPLFETVVNELEKTLCELPEIIVCKKS